MFIAIANFSAQERNKWLIEAYEDPRNAVRFFESKEHALEVLMGCPPIKVSLSYELCAYTPDALGELDYRRMLCIQ